MHILSVTHNLHSTRIVGGGKIIAKREEVERSIIAETKVSWLIWSLSSLCGTLTLLYSLEVDASPRFIIYIAVPIGKDEVSKQLIHGDCL